MYCELYGWFERDSKKNLGVKALKSILRHARRSFMKKHGVVPNFLTVRVDEYQDWMDDMSIGMVKVENNLIPRHFTLTFEDKSNE